MTKKADKALLRAVLEPRKPGALKAMADACSAGADPNLEDEDGWTPWMASTLADEFVRDRIQASLAEFGASRDGEHIAQLVRAVFDGIVVESPGGTRRTSC